jgi:23S rRNA (adenine2503-C2)-methyltransferase
MEPITSRPHFLDLTRDEVRAHLEGLGLLARGPLAADQAFLGVHEKLAKDFASVQGLSWRKVARLTAAFDERPLDLAEAHEAEDGSVRYGWNLADGAVAESVLIPRHGRYSLCLSSQAGCALACRFCATGRLGLRRNLRVHEIVSQVLQAARLAGVRIDGLVFMGMGEPLQNEAAVLQACRILTGVGGQQISPRKISISTAGIVPAIHRFAAASHRMNLVFSLVSAVPEKRGMLMPIQRTYPFDAFLDAIRAYSRSRPGKHVTLEYIAIKGLTLGDDDIEALRTNLTGFPFILNVIPMNPVQGSGLEAPTRAEVKAWSERLRPLGFPVKVRRSAGQDRFAGCGQLGSALLARPGSVGLKAQVGFVAS